jgi:glycosyltransferase involved in cell wall biosynthesis
MYFSKEMSAKEEETISFYPSSKPVLTEINGTSHGVINHSVSSHSVVNHSVSSHSVVNHSVSSHSVVNHSVSSHSVVNHSVCLCVMVKNEEKNILKTLRSAINCYSIINRCIILDTGSTDTTIKIIKDFLDSISFKYKIFSSDFIDFSTSKNFMLQCAFETFPESQYLLVMDANDELVKSEDEEKANSFYEIFNSSNDVYCIKVRVLNDGCVGNNYVMPKFPLFKNNNSFKFTNIVHEQIVLDGKNPSFNFSNNSDDNLPFYIKNDRTYDDSTERQYRDIEVIEKYLEKNPEDKFMSYQLAQTYYNLYNYQKAYESALNTVNKFGKLPLYSEYLFQSYIILGMCKYKLEMGKNNYIESFLDAYNYGKRVAERCEPLCLLAECLLFDGDKEECKRYISLACNKVKPPAHLSKYLMINHYIYDKLRWDVKAKCEI